MDVPIWVAGPILAALLVVVGFVSRKNLDIGKRVVILESLYHETPSGNMPPGLRQFAEHRHVHEAIAAHESNVASERRRAMEDINRQFGDLGGKIDKLTGEMHQINIKLAGAGINGGNRKEAGGLQ